jgi:hypothetical protein
MRTLHWSHKKRSGNRGGSIPETSTGAKKKYKNGASITGSLSFEAPPL